MVLRGLVGDCEGVVELRLFGRFDCDDVEELRASCKGRFDAVRLDLSQLRCVDDIGAAYLRGLVDAGVKLGPVNPYVARLLETGDVDARDAGHGRRST